MDSTLVASPSRRHHLSPMKPMKSSRLRGLANASSGCNTTHQPSATKRSLSSSDENNSSLSLLASPSKRVKSALSSSLHNALKLSSKTQQLGNIAAGTQRKKRAFGALVDVTNTHAQSPAPLLQKGSNEKATQLNPSRTILKPLSVKKPSTSSPRRNARATSPRIGSGRGLKRSYSPPIFKRVDPPASLASTLSSGSIDSLLASATRPSSMSSISSMLAPPLPSNIPDSWIFDIYEDSPEETLQNLMEHSTHTLDISDDESAPSELQARGKENIPPARLAELELLHTALPPPPPAVIPQRKSVGAGPGGRFLREHREALRVMQKEELYFDPPSPDMDVCGGVSLPTLDDDSFITFATPEKEKYVAETPSAPGSPGWAVWESDHECDKDSEEGEVSSVPTSPMESPVMEGVKLEMNEGEAESFRRNILGDEPSDKEN